MNKKEFMDELKNLLSELPQQEINDILSDYEEHFRLGLKDNYSEEKICKSLGSPKKIANEYIDLYSDQKNNQKLSNSEFMKNNDSKIIDANNVKNLDIDTKMADIIIEKEQRENILIEYKYKSNISTCKLEVSVANNTLKIKQLSNNINRFIFFSYQNYKLILHIPEDLEFNNLVLASCSGKIEFYNAISSTIKVKSISGVINLSGDTNSLVVKNTSGKTNLQVLANDYVINSVSGSINLDNNREFNSDKMEISTVSGSIYLNAITHDLTAKSVSGSIRYNGKCSRCKLNTISGSIKVEGEVEDIRVNTTSGSINIEDNVKNVCLNTKSGRINVKSNSKMDGIDCSTLSGSINISIPNDNDTLFYIKTLSGGINSQYPMMSNNTNLKYKCSSKSGRVSVYKNN